jgi:ABC-2 type transport system ATP-binding protein
VSTTPRTLVPDEAAISVTGLRKRYGSRTVVDGLTFSVRRGEVFALLGPNGAGKTTTVETIEGYRRPDDGTVRVLGLDPIRDARSLRPRVGLMLQAGGIYALGRPRELLRLFASFHANPMDPDRLLEQMGLGPLATRPYRGLSGGERQRLSLAVALVGRPEVAILDEPTAGMDPVIRAQTRDLIGGLRATGVTVLMTTHDLGDVEALADHVAIVAHGRLLAEGTPAEIAGAGGTSLTVRFDRPLSVDELAALQAAIPRPSVPEGVRGVRVPAGAADPAIAAAIAGWADRRGVAIASLQGSDRDLEARYLALVGTDEASSPQ